MRGKRPSISLMRCRHFVYASFIPLLRHFASRHVSPRGEGPRDLCISSTEIPPFAQSEPERGLSSSGLHRKFLSIAYMPVNSARMVCLCVVDCLRSILKVDHSGTDR